VIVTLSESVRLESEVNYRRAADAQRDPLRLLSESREAALNFVAAYSQIGTVYRPPSSVVPFG